MAEICDRGHNRGYSPYVPQLFWGMLSKEDVAAVQEQLFHFAGVSVRKRTLRDYMYPSAAHIVGSVGEVNRKDLEDDLAETLRNACDERRLHTVYHWNFLGHQSAGRPGSFSYPSRRPALRFASA